MSGNPDMWYPNGCSEKVHMWFVERLHIIGAIGLVITFIQVNDKMIPERTQKKLYIYI